MKIEKHISYFENVLASKRFDAELLSNNEVEIYCNCGFLYLSDEYVRIPLNLNVGIDDDTMEIDKIDKENITANTLVKLLKGERHTKILLSDTEEKYFQLSTSTNNVYPPSMNEVIQKLVTRWMSENEII